MSIACKVCQSCDAFQDTLLFNLPADGGPFSIAYTDGLDTFQLAGVSANSEVPISVDATITYHLISVIDGNSCPVYSNFENGVELVVGTDPPVLTCEPTAPAPDGSVVFSINNGLPPFTLSWTDTQGAGGSISGDGSAPITISGLTTPGTYQVQVTDAAGCTNACSFELEGPDCTLKLMLEGVSPLCSDPMSGAITANISGQMGNVNYSWSDSNLGGNENFDIAAGIYSLTVSDESACVDSARLEILEADVPDIDLELIESGSCDAGGAVRINSISGGTPPYTFSLDPSVAPQPLEGFPFVLNGLAPGNLNLVIEDQLGCQVITLLPVPSGNDGSNLILDLGFDTDVQRGQGVLIDPIINFLPVSVSWTPETFVENPNAISTTIRPARTTLYIATATDENGCAISDSILIRVADEELAFVPSAFSPNEDGVNDIFRLFPRPEVSEIRTLRIFDRWGKMVYIAESISSDNDAIGWNGLLPNRQKAADGVYLYFAEVLDQAGNEQLIKGSVTLIR